MQHNGRKHPRRLDHCSLIFAAFIAALVILDVTAAAALLNHRNPLSTLLFGSPGNYSGISENSFA